MKKITILLIIAFALFGCSDDDSTSNQIRADFYHGYFLESKWVTIKSTKGEFVNVITTDCSNRSNGGLYWTLDFGQINYNVFDSCSNSILFRGNRISYINGYLTLYPNANDWDDASKYYVRDLGNDNISLEYTQQDGVDVPESSRYTLVLHRQ